VICPTRVENFAPFRVGDRKIPDILSMHTAPGLPTGTTVVATAVRFMGPFSRVGGPMGNRERAFGERFWRTVVIVLAVLGGFAVLDAIVLFAVLLLAAVFIAAPGPYIGLLMFVALLLAAIVGGAMAWMAYTLLNDRALASPADQHHTTV
jgi:hypothetical protein